LGRPKWCVTVVIDQDILPASVPTMRAVVVVMIVEVAESEEVVVDVIEMTETEDQFVTSVIK